MPIIEVYGQEENLIIKIESPFFPSNGDFLSIEKDDYFTYYLVTKRWFRISEAGAVTPCVSVELKD